ncbi:MAG: hypothetical protein WC967_08765, partial [Balneolaceae bacterium]
MRSLKYILGFIFLLFGLGYSTGVIAQERSTQSPEIESFFLSPDLKGAGQNSVNIYSGDVNLPVSLLSISGRGGLNSNVTAFYNSNIQNQRDVWALEAPTSILGLGWSMDYDRIVVDHKNTGTVHDDDFYLISGGASNKLIMTSSTGVNGNKTFETKNYQFWNITYIKSDERWEITKEDGTIFVFGGGVQTVNGLKETPGNVVQWGVKWGNWIGSSSRTQGQQQHAIAWNLSKVRNKWDDEISYKYLLTEEEVGRFGNPDYVNPKKHTKASYLHKIVTPEGKEVEFLYQDKLSDEYTDPHQELTEPYNLIVGIEGPNNVIAGLSNTWNVVVGAGTPPYSYQWEYQSDGYGDWSSGGTGSSFSYTTGASEYAFNIKLTVTDSNNETKNEEMYVSVFHNGQFKSSGCDLDCSPSYSMNEKTINKSVSHNEPDAYQERYEDKYLKRINIKNTKGTILYYLNFDYGFYGTQGDPDFKRLLTGISQEYPGGESLPGLDFEYHNASDVSPAALKMVAYPTGAEVNYTYSQKNIVRAKRDYIIDRPLGYEDPRVWIGNDYVVVTWNQVDDSDSDPDDDIVLQVYTWDGEWILFDHGTIYNTGLKYDAAEGSAVNMVQDFEVFIEDDFFILVKNYYQNKDSRGIYAFKKDDKNRGGWHTNYELLSYSNSKTDVAIGNDYFALADLKDGDVTIFEWNGEQWNKGTKYHSTIGPGNNFFMNGNKNYFVTNNQGASTNDEISVYFLDELRKWGKKSITSNNINSKIDSDGNSARNYISTGNSMFAFAFNDNGNDNNGYIFRLSDTYQPIGTTYIGKLDNRSSPIYLLNDELIFFNQLTKSKAYRYNGVGWNTVSSSFFAQSTGTMSVGADYIIQRLYPYSSEDGYYTTYDPNSLSWSETSFIYDNISGGEYRLYPDIVGNISIFGRKGFYRMPDGNFASLIDLTAPAGRKLEYLSVKTGLNFIAYETDSERSLVEPLSHVKIVKNGTDHSLINLSSVSPNSKRISTGGTALGYQKPNFISPSVIVSYNTLNFKNATQIVLHKILDGEVTGNIKDYPVTKLEVNNGYETSRVELSYDVSTATIDPSGSIAQYNKVTVENGNTAEGRTENYFFNGLSNNALVESYPGIGPYSNAHSNQSQVKGLLYKTKSYNSSNSLVSETINYWNVFEKSISRKSDNKQIDRAYYVRQRKVENVLDGVSTYSITQYNSENGLPEKSTTSNHDIDGRLSNKSLLKVAEIRGFETGAECPFLFTLSGVFVVG